MRAVRKEIGDFADCLIAASRRPVEEEIGGTSRSGLEN